METKYYLAYQKKGELRSKSQSGGISLALVTETLNRGGVVYACCYSDEFKAKHIRIVEKRDAEKSCRSKYVQSDLGDSFIQVANDLNSGKDVLFTGTSCQVDGLLGFLNVKGINTEKLCTVDIVCHGVPSPLILSRFLEYLESSHKSRLTDVNLRNKKYSPVNNATFRFETGEEIINNGYSDLFYTNVMLRPCCGECRYATVNKPSDITIGDVVKISEKLYTEADRKDPKSIVMARTEKGKTMLDNPSLSLVRIEREDFDQNNLHSATRISPQRDKFWKDFSKGGIEYVLKKYTGLGGPTTKLRRKILQKLNKW